MPIGEDHLKKCKCCGMKSVSYELIFVCSKCTIKGHTGFISCDVCEKNKKDNSK